MLVTDRRDISRAPWRPQSIVLECVIPEGSRAHLPGGQGACEIAGARRGLRGPWGLHAGKREECQELLVCADFSPTTDTLSGDSEESD